MKREVFERELAKIISISKDFGVEKVLLFGSCLEEVESAQDIDIAVKGIKPREFFKYYGKVSMAVDDEVDIDEVDIVDLDDAREHLYKRILSKGRIIYERGI
jgi:predicted nucleotidyltransferase